MLYIRNVGGVKSNFRRVTLSAAKQLERFVTTRKFFYEKEKKRQPREAAFCICFFYSQFSSAKAFKNA